MRLDLSVPKTNPVSCGEDGEDGLLLSTLREGMERALADRSGRTLILSDSTAFSQFVPAARSEHTLCMLWEGDALALFALPEVQQVLVSGGRDALEAARFFAHVRRIACTVFPQHAALDGAFGSRARVRLGENTLDVPLAQAHVVADLACMTGTLAEGYARLILSRLALFEARALGMICRKKWGGAAYEEAFSIAEPVRGELAPEEIVTANARLRQLETAGAPVGEGATLASLCSEQRYPAATAFLTLSALYTAFLERGVPRRYMVPDYAGRAQRAGTKYADLRLPTAAGYATRALGLERARGELLTQMRHIRAAKQAQLAAMRTLDGHFSASPILEKLKILPEHAPDGLCAVLRDFGLLEWS